MLLSMVLSAGVLFVIHANVCYVCVSEGVGQGRDVVIVWCVVSDGGCVRMCMCRNGGCACLCIW